MPTINPTRGALRQVPPAQIHMRARANAREGLTCEAFSAFTHVLLPPGGKKGSPKAYG